MTDDLLGGRRWRVIQGDVLEVLGGMPDESVHCVVTSPPYWGLRDYGIPPTIWDSVEGCGHEWGTVIKPASSGGKHNSQLEGGKLHQYGSATHEAQLSAFCRLCSAWRGSLGLEPTIELYVRHLVTVFREIRRVLRRDGTCWLNISDSYASGKGTCFNPGGGAFSLEANKKAQGAYPLDRGNTSILRTMGLKPKDLCLIPARVALALQSDGWWIRSRIIWAKGVSFCKTYSGSSMPESVRDRPSTSYEDVYLLTKAKTYYYDNEAVKEQSSSGPSDIKKMLESKPRIGGKHKLLNDPYSRASQATNIGQKRAVGNPAGRNLRSVWLINPSPFKGSHFSTFPPALVEPMIKAGTSEKGVCPECGAPWRRVVEKPTPPASVFTKAHAPIPDSMRVDGQTRTSVTKDGRGSGQKYQNWLNENPSRTIGWQATCDCGLPEEDCVPPIVLDPFLGSGTSIMVALRLGRRAIGIDISEDYCQMARKRIIEDCPMWNTP